MAEGANNKDVVYVDVDDEITGIIDKVRSSRHQIVALVIPKRSAVLQSIVNMKLLKRTADGAKKNVVLITSDEGLLPLAGNVGMHVARNLQSKPEIPQGPSSADLKPEAAEEPIAMAGKFGDEAPVDKSKTVGELSGLAPTDDSAIELDDEEEEKPEKPSDADGGKKNKKDKGKKPKKNKALQVPDFNRFRSWLLIGACFIVVFLILLYVALTVLPKATITVDTNSQTVPTNLQITLSSSAQSVDPSTATVPAQTAQTQKSYTGTANTTGQQNNGQKANGSVTLTAQACAPNLGTPNSIPAGTGVSANSLTFITQSNANFNFTGFSGGNCANYSTQPVSITAQNGGSQYNLSSATFTVSGDSGVSGNGTTSGGTDQIQQIVAQADITSAQNKINTSSSAIKSQLESDLQSEGLFPIVATYTSTSPSPTPSAAVGSPASSVTVTESITYTMQGVKQSDLQALVGNSVDGQISTTSQKILDYGISNATFSSQGSDSVSMQADALVGFALNKATIKSKAAGQKSGDAQQIIRGYSGVTNVSVHLSPFWVSSIPSKTSKITVNIVNPKS